MLLNQYLSRHIYIETHTIFLNLSFAGARQRQVLLLFRRFHVIGRIRLISPNNYVT